jgi:hypothetical protein
MIAKADFTTRSVVDSILTQSNFNEKGEKAANKVKNFLT